MNKAHMNSKKLKQYAQGLHKSAASPLCIYYGFSFSVFIVLMSEGMTGSLILMLFLEFFVLCWSALSNFNVIDLVLSYYIFIL